VGETKQVVTISEYLYKELLGQVVGTLNELVDQKDRAMYKRDPARWEDLVNRTAVKLIKRIRDDK
jgi:hypothetical protein